MTDEQKIKNYLEEKFGVQFRPQTEYMPGECVVFKTCPDNPDAHFASEQNAFVLGEIMGRTNLGSYSVCYFSKTEKTLLMKHLLHSEMFQVPIDQYIYLQQRVLEDIFKEDLNS